MPNRRGFRPPKVEPSTSWGRHLVAFRRDHDWSQSYAFELWAEGLGKGERSRTAYRDIELGKRDPNPQEAAYLIEQTGEPAAAPPPPIEQPSDMAALIEALKGQTDAITKLVTRLDRLASISTLEGVAEALEEARAAGALPGGGGSRPVRPPSQSV